MKLEGKVAVITGTSRGIGRAMALLFAREGARVVGCSTQGPQGSPSGASFLDELPDDLAERCRFEKCDVTISAEVDRFTRRLVAQVGAPHIVVNNAGVVARGALDSLAEKDWQRVLAVNLTGTFLITRSLLPAMKSNGGGRIINIASIAGRQGTPMLSAYCAAKHGVVGLTRSMAEELRPFAIAANAICPGSVDTEMLRSGMPGGEPIMTPRQVADVALFLAADAPPSLTGSCVDVFG